MRTRLLALARERKQTFDLILTRYAIERLLYRLSTGRFRDRFVLKGAMLMTTWFDVPFRPTRDLDLMGYGDPDADGILGIFAEVCAIEGDDGVVFDSKGFVVDRMREELEDGGLRLRTNADIGGATVRVSIDIGFGDATEPGLEEIDYPVLLGSPAPRLRAYVRETVIAEKFQAMVTLGRANSRMRTFTTYGCCRGRIRSRTIGWRAPLPQPFSGGGRDPHRHSRFPDTGLRSPAKQQQWTAFVRGLEEDVPSLVDTIADLAEFLMPVVAMARQPTG